MIEALSNFAIVTLDQLRRKATESGDLVSKCGRDELLKLGLCKYENGKWCLTEWGAKGAAEMAYCDWQSRPEKLN